MRTILVAVTLMVAGVSAQTPVEIDRTIQRVNGTAIMTSDVRQARLLRLLSPMPSSDDAILTALENRLLMVNEATRAAVGEPAAAQIAARRQRWSASWSSGADLANQIQRAGITDRALDAWFRDDLRVESYLEQRFPPDPKREERMAAWIRDLRQRANLSVKIGAAG